MTTKFLNMSAEAREIPTTHPSTVFFICYRCSEWTMRVTPFGVYCRGCGMNAFTSPGEVRIEGACETGHHELVESKHRSRCLVCSTLRGLN